MKPPLIINLSVDGRDKYSERVQGLKDSISKYWAHDIAYYSNYHFCRPHSEIPYAFKYDLIYVNATLKYRKIWWADATMRLNGDIMPLMDNNPTGVVCFENIGHATRKYLNDEAMRNLECESYIDDVPNIWGGMLGFDLDNPIAAEAFRQILDQIEFGSFSDGGSTRPEFVASRHDQSVCAVVFHRLGIKPYPYGVIASKADMTKETLVIYGD